MNLHLAVGPARRDGFHELLTVFQAVDLYDEVTARPGAGLTIKVSGEAAGVPTDETNLAWHAADLVADYSGAAAHARLEIIKRIPVAGGMAGGSADAAAAMVACAQLWGCGDLLDDGATGLMFLAARLGSDVAFPLLGGTALGTGRGDVVAPVLTTGTFHWVFALADFGISAADAYRELDRQRGADPVPMRSADPVLDAVRAGDPKRLAAALHNDLQPAVLALAPSLAITLEAGRDLGALAGIVSGSGPTCAFLCAGREAAEQLAEALTGEATCRRAVVATGPAPGARIMRLSADQ